MGLEKPRLRSSTSISDVSLARRGFTSLPAEPPEGDLTAVIRLDLSENKLTDLPEWLGNLTALTELDLSGNQLTDLPEWLGNLTALTELDLSGNQLTDLPEWLGNLTALTTLRLGKGRGGAGVRVWVLDP